MPTTADDVRAVLACLAEASVDARLAGGWGVDALVGRQTREHRDLDLAVVAERLDDAVSALQQLGFSVTTDWLPVRVELSEGDRHLDLHPLHYRDDGSAWQSGLDDTTFEYPVDGWTTGHVGSTEVRCLTAERQRLYHSGYPLRPVDVHDLDQLLRVEAQRAVKSPSRTTAGNDSVR